MQPHRPSTSPLFVRRAAARTEVEYQSSDERNSAGGAGEAVGRWGAVAVAVEVEVDVDVEDRHRRVVGQAPCGASAISPASAIASISAAV